MSGLFHELKRRNVFRVGIAYVVAAWVLLQVADLVLENIAAPDWVMQVFMLAVLAGFPLVLIFAWAFELTPEGVKREKDVVRAESVTPQTGRKLDRIIIGFLAVAVVFLLLDRIRGMDREATQPTAAQAPATEAMQGEARDRSIAVLPLANRSASPEDAFFAEGIHDELLTRLSRISALRVISRTSVMAYAGTTKRIAEIGRELGVATLLEGGVQRAGNRVRINVQLIDAGSDEHLWAQVYDRELTTDNLFDIQSDITQAIAGALQAVLTGEEQRGLERKPTENVEAYAHYLRGKAKSQGYGRSPEQIMETIIYYQQALELDPDFAEAWAALATDWTERYWQSSKLGDELDQARAALEKAQALAPDNPETLVAEGYYHYWGHLDYAPAIQAFDAALDREPGKLLALRGKAYALRRMGRLDDSIAAFEQIVALDPLDPQIPADMGWTLMHAGQFGRAQKMLRHAYTLDPVNSWNRYSRSELSKTEGDFEGATQVLGPVSDLTPPYLLAAHLDVQIARGDLAAARQTLDNLGAFDVEEWRLPERYNRAVVARLAADTAAFDAALAELENYATTLAQQKPGQEVTVLAAVAVAGLKGDREALTRAIEQYHAALKPDAMRIVEEYTVLDALAFTGDTEGVLAYLQDLVAKFGPWELHYARYMPYFDAMRDEPRFQALMAQYDRWRAGVAGGSGG